MNDEELIERIVALNYREFGASVGNDLKRIIIKKENELDKYKNIVDKIKKLCDENTNGVDDDGYDDAYYDRVYVREIDEIIEKELKGE